MQFHINRENGKPIQTLLPSYKLVAMTRQQESKLYASEFEKLGIRFVLESETFKGGK